jgi:surface polysaccharide O-acyltransferase-like enzyme
MENEKVVVGRALYAENQGKHLFWADVLRVIAAFAVVLIHSGFSRPSLGSGHHTLPDLLIAAVSIIARPAVVWFFFLSGTLLLSKEEPLGAFASKRMLKIAVPLLFWSSFYLGLTAIDSESALPQLNWDLISGGVFYHLWFLHALFVIYLTIPLLRKFCGHLKLMILFLVIWFSSAYLIPLAAEAFGGHSADFTYDTNYLVSYIGYPVLGFVIASYLPKIPLRIMAVIWLLITCSALAIASQFDFSFNVLYSYKSPLILFFACIGFILAKQIPAPLRQSRITYLLSSLASSSFGIYLIHPFILRLISILPSQNYVNELTLISMKAAVTFVMSYLCVYFIRKTSLGRWVTP